MRIDRRRRGSETRLLRGYGPLLGFVAAFLVMALLAPTVAPEERVTSQVPAGNVGSVDGGVPDAESGDGSSTTAAEAGAGAGADADGGQAGGGAETATGAVPGAQPCEGPHIQNDPYSPPCVLFEGDNGGATSRGVDAGTIKVALRDPGPPYDVGSVVAELTGTNPTGRKTTRDDYLRTYETLIAYFNKAFQFYGRKLELVVYEGQGSLFDEILGGGQSAANADAIKTAKEIGAFADISAEPPVFGDALQKQGVVLSNPIYPSREWFAQRAPHAFSLLPDCTKIIDFVSEFIIKQVAGRKVIAGEFKGQDRKIGVVYPQAPIYQECGDRARKSLEDAGVPVANYKLYTLSLDGIPNDAGPIASQFANEGITTVVLGTDPLMPYFLTTNATQSDWYPEWINTGVAYMDADWAGQLYDVDQWKNSFGVSLIGPHQPARATYGYAAYQSIDPNTSPEPLLVEAIYYQLYLLATGIHMAGPNLTPDSYAAGLRQYRSPATGPQGTWAFPEGDYSAPQDGRIIWWDPNLTSVYNGAPGAYRDTGERFPFGGLPEGPPPVDLAS